MTILINPLRNCISYFNTSVLLNRGRYVGVVEKLRMQHESSGIIIKRGLVGLVNPNINYNSWDSSNIYLEFLTIKTNQGLKVKQFPKPLHSFVDASWKKNSPPFYIHILVVKSSKFRINYQTDIYQDSVFLFWS